MDVAAKTKFSVLFAIFDTGLTGFQRFEHFGLVVSNAGNNAEPRDDYSPHVSSVKIVR